MRKWKKMAGRQYISGVRERSEGNRSREYRENKETRRGSKRKKPNERRTGRKS